MKKKGLLIVVSGFAGTGKGTVMKGLLAKYSVHTAHCIWVVSQIQ